VHASSCQFALIEAAHHGKIRATGASVHCADQGFQ
jgi:hypothetical protein